MPTSRIEVTFPGVPPEEVLQTMWLQGVLKYEAYKQYLSSMYCIPLTAFHDKMQLTLEDLNGVKPVESKPKRKKT